MFFLQPDETPYDLRWWMFGIHVRVHPMFWLVSIVMGWNSTQMGLHYLLIWIGCVFVSILIHELGHVVMGRIFGARGHIVLYSFGGLAIGSNQLYRRWQRILVCFAGPLAGFLFIAVLLGLLGLINRDLFQGYLWQALASVGISWNNPAAAGQYLQIMVLHGPLVEFLLTQLFFINLLWGLVNLLPVWPLDGGQISRDVCEGISYERGLRISLGISLVVAGLLALHSLLVANGRQLLPLPFGSVYSALLFGLLAVQSFQLLQQASAQRRWLDDHWR